MAFIYQTPLDLGRAVRSGLQFLTGTKSLEQLDLSSSEDQCIESQVQYHQVCGTIRMTIGVAALILGATGCYAYYSGRLGQLGLPCAAVGVPLTILGWDVIQLGRFTYHSADPDKLKSQPKIYGAVHTCHCPMPPGVNIDLIRKVQELMRSNSTSLEATEIREQLLAARAANTIAARFRCVFNMLDSIASPLGV